MGFGLTTSFLMACHTYVIVFERDWHHSILKSAPFSISLLSSLIPSYSNCLLFRPTHLLLNFQSSTIGGKHLLLLNQFMNLFGMPPLLGGGKDGLKIGSVGLLLIVTEVQVESLIYFNIYGCKYMLLLLLSYTVIHSFIIS